MVFEIDQERKPPEFTFNIFLSWYVKVIYFKIWDIYINFVVLATRPPECSILPSFPVANFMQCQFHIL